PHPGRQRAGHGRRGARHPRRSGGERAGARHVPDRAARRRRSTRGEPMTHRNVYMTDELQAIYDQTVEFVAKEVKPSGEQWEAEGKVPREVLRKMGELGMLGLRVPEQYGGLGLGPLASATFAEALGSSTFGGFDVTVLVHTDMAGPHLIN